MSEKMKIQVRQSEVQLTADDAQEWLSTRLHPGMRELRGTELMARGAVIPEKQWESPPLMFVWFLWATTLVL